MVHLVLFASEQTIPNLMAVELVRRTRPGEVLQVHIYTTASPEKSIVPGEKLKWLIEGHKRRAVVEIGPEYRLESAGPDDIRAYLSALMHESTDEWFVCLNGGTRLMTYGFLGLFEEPGLLCFYRDLETGKWYDLKDQNGKVNATDSTLLSGHQSQKYHSELLADYTIRELIELQHPGRHSRMGENYDFRVGRKDEEEECGEIPGRLKLSYQALMELLKKDSTGQFKWREISNSTEDSTIFEDLIAHLIIAFYPSKFAADPHWQIRTRVKLFAKNSLLQPTTIRQLNEIDVVLFDGNALHLFEMKLKTMDSDETLPALVTRYAQLRRQLAGLAGTATIVAPNSIRNSGNSEESDELLRASAQTFDVNLWGISELIDIAQNLVRLLGVPIEMPGACRLESFSCLRPQLVPIAKGSLVNLAWDFIKLKHAQVASISQEGHKEKFQFFPCNENDRDELSKLLSQVVHPDTLIPCKRTSPSTFAGLGTWSEENILKQLEKISQAKSERVLKIARRKLGYDPNLSPTPPLAPASTAKAQASSSLDLSWPDSPGG